MSMQHTDSGAFALSLAAGCESTWQAVHVNAPYVQSPASSVFMYASAWLLPRSVVTCDAQHYLD